MLGGFGASLRVPVIKDKLTFGVKGLYGPGMGRYGNSTLSDVTNNADGQICTDPQRSAACSRWKPHPHRACCIYFNYGGDYAARTDYAHHRHHARAILRLLLPDRMTAANASTNCRHAVLRPLLPRTAAAWGSHFTAAPAITAVGYGSRYASISATCAAVAAPGLDSGRFDRLSARRHWMRQQHPQRAGGHRRLLV